MVCVLYVHVHYIHLPYYTDCESLAIQVASTQTVACNRVTTKAKSTVYSLRNCTSHVITFMQATGCDILTIMLHNYSGDNLTMYRPLRRDSLTTQATCTTL